MKATGFEGYITYEIGVNASSILEAEKKLRETEEIIRQAVVKHYPISLKTLSIKIK